jgi:RecB family exonuclease
MLDGTMDVLALNAGEALVVDFKTGQWPDTPDGELRFGLQARCYALAAIRSGSNHVEVVFVGLGSRGDEPPTTRFCFTRDDAAAIEDELLGIHRSIVSGPGKLSNGD